MTDVSPQYASTSTLKGSLGRRRPTEDPHRARGGTGRRSHGSQSSAPPHLRRGIEPLDLLLGELEAGGGDVLGQVVRRAGAGDGSMTWLRCNSQARATWPVAGQ